MYRSTTLLIGLILMNPIPLSAEKMIISEGDINETVVRDYFSITPLDHLFIDWNKLNIVMDRLDEQVTTEPINAKLDEQGKIVKEELGFQLDRIKFITMFQNFFYNPSTQTVTLPKKYIYPQVDSELLAEIRTNELAAYHTSFQMSNKERTNNIKLATTAINNYVVFPNEKFSFNQVVGQRTKEKGYMRAPVIVKGELAEDIGGGICQVSSTLFNAVDLPGIEMVERYSHSREVPYVPPGKDATVSWWGPDFVFKNNYTHPILIRAQVKDNVVLIKIYSSNDAQERSLVSLKSKDH